MVFIHIPKTAGTSVEAALGHHGEHGVQRGVQDHRTLRQLQWPWGGVGQFGSLDNCRESARAVKGRLRRDDFAANRVTLDRAQYRSYFKFAIVRNPWARTFSWYKNVLPDDLHRARLGITEDVSFADFVTRFAGSDLLRAQTHWLLDFGGRIGVDLVCRFERLEADYDRACGLARLPQVPLPHLNPSGAGDYLAAYDDRTRRLIADRYRHEIALFGYTFDGGPAPVGP